MTHNDFQVFILSAASPSALNQRAYLFSMLAQKRKNTPLREFCKNVVQHQTFEKYRCAIIVSSLSELTDALDKFAQNQKRPFILQGAASQSTALKTLWIFSGLGSQYIGMGHQLYDSSTVFRSAMEACDAALAPHFNVSTIDEYLKTQADDRNSSPMVIQPMIFSVQVALAAVWKHWGISPNAVIGHSMGEVTAAHIADVIDLDTAARILFERSRVLEKIKGQGMMASIALNRPDTEAQISQLPNVSVAAINSKSDTVISGDTNNIKQLLNTLSEETVKFTRLADTPGHSEFLDEFIGSFQSSLSDIIPQNARVDFYSTVEGSLVCGSELTPEYWGKNLRRTVEFSDTIKMAIENGYNSISEVSPQPILLPSIEGDLRSIAKTDLRLVPSLRRNKSDRQSMLISLAKLFIAGHKVDWENIYS